MIIPYVPLETGHGGKHRWVTFFMELRVHSAFICSIRAKLAQIAEDAANFPHLRIKTNPDKNHIKKK